MSYNKKISVILLLLAVALALAAVPAVRAQETKTLIQQSDDLYVQRGDLDKAKLALAKLQEALTAKETSYGVYWRMARLEYWIGDHTADKAVKKQIFQQGIEHAKRAIERGVDKVEGHFWLGVCYGVYGEAKGVLKSLALVKPIKEEMRRVLEIDPAYDRGGADRVLGRVYHEVPGIAGGSEKKSLEHLLKAVEYGPRVGLNLLYLADTYISLKQIEKAREKLEYILTMEPEPDLIPETEEERAQARQRLAGKEFKKDK